MEPNYTKFRKELEGFINSHSMENGSDTPDFILAEYLQGCLVMFDKAVNQRTKWYGADTPVTDLVSLDSADSTDAANPQGKEQQ